MMKKTFLPLVCMVSALCSCQHDPPPPIPAPVVVINEPVANQVFDNGDTLFIDADLTDPNGLESANIVIMDSATTVLDLTLSIPDLDSVHLDTFWIVTGTLFQDPGSIAVTAENQPGKTTTISRLIYFNY